MSLLVNRLGKSAMALILSLWTVSHGTATLSSSKSYSGGLVAVSVAWWLSSWRLRQMLESTPASTPATVTGERDGGGVGGGGSVAARVDEKKRA
jgi:protein-S-isoprenylcysteine O-methyltransferase Ste14